MSAAGRTRWGIIGAADLDLADITGGSIFYKCQNGQMIEGSSARFSLHIQGISTIIELFPGGT